MSDATDVMEVEDPEVGDGIVFKVGGEMTPFVAQRVNGEHIRLVTTDLTHEAWITVYEWKKQKRILAKAEGRNE